MRNLPVRRPRRRSTVDQATEVAEQLRCPVYFVKHDEAVLVSAEKQVRIGQLRSVRARFQVQVQCVATLRDLHRQCGLADLPGADQTDRGLAIQCGGDCWEGVTWNHAC